MDTKKLKNKKQNKLKTTTGKRDEIVKNFWKTLFHTMSVLTYLFRFILCFLLFHPASVDAEDKSAGSKNTGGRKHAFTEVYFHIIVSPTLLPSSNKGDVFVHFQSSTLAGWNSRKHKMNLKRYVNTVIDLLYIPDLILKLYAFMPFL
jgi:hypothetical protein